MKKGLINPVLQNIRSANYQSPRYSMNRTNETYPQSIKNMSGSGYNQDSQKLRTLLDDAKGIAIGARPNSEQNTKRFWGLYGQQANVAPYQATREMDYNMRRNVEELRHGSANRRISKSANVKKEAYYNTLGGGYDPNVVVTPKKGRPYKGQPDSLPLVAKRAKNISKAGNAPDYISYINRNKATENPNSKSYIPYAGTTSQSRERKLVEEFDPIVEADKFRQWWRGMYQSNPNLSGPAQGAQALHQKVIPYDYSFTESVPRKTFKDRNLKRYVTRDDVNQFWTNAAYNYNPSFNISSAAYALAPKSAADTRVPIPGLPDRKTLTNSFLGPKVGNFIADAIGNKQRNLGTYADSLVGKQLLDPYFTAGMNAPIALQVADKAPKFIGRKIPKAAPYTARYASAVEPAMKIARPYAESVKYLDYFTGAQGLANYRGAAETEGKYQFPTTMDTSGKTQDAAYLPQIVDTKYGNAANRQFGPMYENILALAGAGAGAVGNLSKPILNKIPFPGYNKWDMKDLYVNTVPQKTRMDIRDAYEDAYEAAQPYLNSLSNAWENANFNPFYRESIGRPKLPAKFSDLSVQQQQEYGRFGRPYETRFKPSLGRQIMDIPVIALTGSGFIGRGYKPDVGNDQSTYDKIINNLTEYFGDTGVHAGQNAKTLTEAYGYDQYGNLVATRLNRKINPKNPGKNMAPFRQLTTKDVVDEMNFAQPYMQFVEDPTAQGEGNIYENWLESQNLNPKLEYKNTNPNAKSEYRPVEVFDPYAPNYMYGAQLGNTPENNSPYYVQESPEDYDRQGFLRLLFSSRPPQTEEEKANFKEQLLNSIQQNKANSLFGKRQQSINKSLKKSTNNITLNGVKHVVGGLKNKNITKSISKTTHNKNVSSLKHSNKYMK